MIIELTKLTAQETEFAGEEPAAILDLPENDPLRPAGPIEYELTAQLLTNELLVRGRLRAPVETACVRCGEFFSTTLEDSSFLRDYEIRAGMETVDITEDLREAVLLAAQAYPLCREDCQGVCARCGRNLNWGPCFCPPENRVDRAWHALENLEITKNK